jgi:signal peptidase I
MRSILSFIEFLVYPFTFPMRSLRNKEASTGAKTFAVLFSLLVLLPIWAGGYVFFSIAVWVGGQYAGIVKMDIPVVGASMLPTIEESGFVAVNHYPHLPPAPTLQKYYDYTKLEPELDRGDIVVFKNDKTTEVFDEQHKDPRKRGGFVKRVIGIAGDTVAIRNGFVLVNGKTITEPYILKARSTFGGEAVPDCEVVKVPKGQYMVLGDNRKVSLDSRHIGLIDKKDVQYYLKLSEQQKMFGSRWRDASKDQASAFESELDVEKYVELLNRKRAEYGIAPLKLQNKLSQSAERRAKVMLEYNDMSFEATRSGYTMKDALAQVGYSNIVYGEFPVLGYYTSEELIDSFFEYPDSADFLLQKDYQEIGLSTFVGTLNDCPVQIVVQHLAGYIPPKYEQKDLNEWKDLLNKLTEIKDGWLALKENEDFYKENQADIDRINEIIRIRASRARAIIKRMESKEWFTDEERTFLSDDKSLFDEQNAIAERINTRLKGDGE